MPVGIGRETSFLSPLHTNPRRLHSLSYLRSISFSLTCTAASIQAAAAIRVVYIVSRQSLEDLYSLSLSPSLLRVLYLHTHLHDLCDSPNYKVRIVYAAAPLQRVQCVHSWSSRIAICSFLVSLSLSLFLPTRIFLSLFDFLSHDSAAR